MPALMGGGALVMAEPTETFHPQIITAALLPALF